MDTRTKIVGFEQALEIAREREVLWVTGHFDPLLAEHARRVREFVKPGQPLIVVVTNPPSPLMPQAARAELVAALADVDYVVLRESPGPSDEPEDARITQDFIAHVVRRNAGEPA